jgi:hypothetical protein
MSELSGGVAAKNLGGARRAGTMKGGTSWRSKSGDIGSTAKLGERPSALALAASQNPLSLPAGSGMAERNKFSGS